MELASGQKNPTKQKKNKQKKNPRKRVPGSQPHALVMKPCSYIENYWQKMGNI